MGLPVEPPREKEGGMMFGFGRRKTMGAVLCPEHGKVPLTKKVYYAQLDAPGIGWACPRCGAVAEWLDEQRVRGRALVALNEDGKVVAITMGHWVEPTLTPEQYTRWYHMAGAVRALWVTLTVDRDSSRPHSSESGTVPREPEG